VETKATTNSCVMFSTNFILKQPYTEDGAAAEKRKYTTRKTP